MSNDDIVESPKNEGKIEIMKNDQEEKVQKSQNFNLVPV